MGHDGSGRSLKIRASEPVAEIARVGGNVLRGRLPSWQRVVVRTGAQGGSVRAWVLEPGPDEDAIEHAPFRVLGRFRVVASANSSREAERLWKETEVG